MLDQKNNFKEAKSIKNPAILELQMFALYCYLQKHQW